MATLFVDKIDPQSGTTLSLGSSGDTLQPTAGTVNNLGITVADTWRLTTTFTDSANPISSNLEQVDAPAGFGILGSSMTESSGVFTFPSTGYWLILATFGFFCASGQTDTNETGRIQITTDDSSYNLASMCRASGSASEYDSTSCFFVADVTDTANVKVNFRVVVNNTATSTVGNTARNETAFQFIKLGAT